MIFGDERLCSELVSKIDKAASSVGRDVRLMEVCGTHTQTVARYGIKSVMPGSVRLVSGPGCPVCVTPQKDIDSVVELALNGVTVATYGDMIRVPGSRMSLLEARSKGARVEVVYSVSEALKLEGDVCFFGVGFETTAPMSALAIKKGLCVYCVHKTMPNALSIIAGQSRIDGFINPGHVSAIIGSDAYKGIDAAQVISGFEGADVLASILMLLVQIRNGERKVEVEYTRAVGPSGNTRARAVIDEVFEPEDAFWRGLGVVPRSGLKIRERFKRCDAKVKYDEILSGVRESETHTGCRCGDVLCGVIEPQECGLFARKCTPSKPIGACMVSGEGACGIAYRNMSQDFTSMMSSE